MFKYTDTPYFILLYLLKFGIRTLTNLLKQSKLSVLFNSQIKSIRLVVKETVCSKRRTDVNDEVVKRPVS